MLKSMEEDEVFDIRAEFNRRLVNAIYDMDISIREFCRENRINRNTLYKSDRLLLPQTVYKICKKYNISMDYLYGFSDKMFIGGQ